MTELEESQSTVVLLYVQIAQLLLNLDSSNISVCAGRFNSSGPKRIFLAGEPFELALCAVARQLMEVGKDKYANKVLGLAR